MYIFLYIHVLSIHVYTYQFSSWGNNFILLSFSAHFQYVNLIFNELLSMRIFKLGYLRKEEEDCLIMFFVCCHWQKNVLCIQRIFLLVSLQIKFSFRLRKIETFWKWEWELKRKSYKKKNEKKWIFMQIFHTRYKNSFPLYNLHVSSVRSLPWHIHLLSLIHIRNIFLNTFPFFAASPSSTMNNNSLELLSIILQSSSSSGLFCHNSSLSSHISCPSFWSSITLLYSMLRDRIHFLCLSFLSLRLSLYLSCHHSILVLKRLEREKD